MEEKVWVNIVDILWPVGSLYWCLDGAATDPTAVVGGSWIQCPGESLSVGNFTYICYRRIV